MAAARPGAHATTSLKGSSRGGTSPPAASATATLDDLGQGTGCSTGRTVQRHHSTWQCRLPHRQPPARQCLEGVRPQHTRNRQITKRKLHPPSTDHKGCCCCWNEPGVAPVALGQQQQQLLSALWPCRPFAVLIPPSQTMSNQQQVQLAATAFPPSISTVTSLALQIVKRASGKGSHSTLW